MKKQSGRTRHVQFEGECYVSASDLASRLRDLGDPHFLHVARYLECIMLDNANIVPGMPDNKKQEWNDIMKPN